MKLVDKQGYALFGVSKSTSQKTKDSVVFLTTLEGTDYPAYMADQGDKLREEYDYIRIYSEVTMVDVSKDPLEVFDGTVPLTQRVGEFDLAVAPLEDTPRDLTATNVYSLRQFEDRLLSSPQRLRRNPYGEILVRRKPLYQGKFTLSKVRASLDELRAYERENKCRIYIMWDKAVQ